MSQYINSMSEFHQDATILFQKNINDITGEEINTFIEKHKQFMINQKCDPYDGEENKDDPSNLSHTKWGKLVCIQRCFRESLFRKRSLPAIGKIYTRPTRIPLGWEDTFVHPNPSATGTIADEVDPYEFENHIERLVRIHNILCLKCNSFPETKHAALDGGSFTCSNKKCKVGRMHYCKNDQRVKTGIPMGCCMGNIKQKNDDGKDDDGEKNPEPKEKQTKKKQKK